VVTTRPTRKTALESVAVAGLSACLSPVSPKSHAQHGSSAPFSAVDEPLQHLHHSRPREYRNRAARQARPHGVATSAQPLVAARTERPHPVAARPQHRPPPAPEATAGVCCHKHEEAVEEDGPQAQDVDLRRGLGAGRQIRPIRHRIRQPNRLDGKPPARGSRGRCRHRHGLMRDTEGPAAAFLAAAGLPADRSGSGKGAGGDGRAPVAARLRGRPRGRRGGQEPKRFRLACLNLITVSTRSQSRTPFKWVPLIFSNCFNKKKKNNKTLLLIRSTAFIKDLFSKSNASYS
jgi:hypothetical protein